MPADPSDLLRPSLAHSAPRLSPYSLQALFLTSFFGGPLAALGMLALNARRLGRLRRDVPWLVVALLAYVLLEAVLALSPAGRGFIAQADAWLGRRAIEYLVRALALAVFALGLVMHRREHKAAELMGLTRPSPWLPALALVFGCSLLAELLRNFMQ